MGTCCVAGCSDLLINEKSKTLTIKDGNLILKEGEFISLDGSTGKVYEGKITTQDPILSGSFGKLMVWADGIRKIGVRTNADTPTDAAVARSFGAEGIGLCRTEHMFFEGDRIKAVLKRSGAELGSVQSVPAMADGPARREDRHGGRVGPHVARFGRREQPHTFSQAPVTVSELHVFPSPAAVRRRIYPFTAPATMPLMMCLCRTR